MARRRTIRIDGTSVAANFVSLGELLVDLAAETSQRLNIALSGFLRDDQFNIYAESDGTTGRPLALPKSR